TYAWLTEGELRPKWEMVRRDLVSRDAELVSAAAIDGDGSLVAAGKGNGDILLFNGLSSLEPVIFAANAAHAGSVDALAFGPDGSRFVSAAEDRTIFLWRTRQVPGYHQIEGEVTEYFTGNPGIAARFTPDGQRLLIAADNSILSVDPLKPSVQGSPIVCKGTNLRSIAVSPDGNLVAVVGPPAEVHLVDLHAGRCDDNPMRPSSRVNNSAIEDLTLFVGRLRIDGFSFFKDGRATPALTAGNDTVTAPALRSDGGLAVVPQGRGLALFDVIKQQLLADLPMLTDAVLSVEFSPNGRQRAVVAGSHAFLYELDPEVWKRRACELAHRNLTPAEWKRYFGSDVQYRTTCFTS
ncbi:MAG: WD40 repeat domain-containing protein, partial [bacterium]